MVLLEQHDGVGGHPGSPEGGWVQAVRRSAARSRRGHASWQRWPGAAGPAGRDRRHRRAAGRRARGDGGGEPDAATGRLEPPTGEPRRPAPRRRPRLPRRRRRPRRPRRPIRRPTFDRAAAMATVRSLARGGPREATSPAYRRAADRVQQRFAELGYSHPAAGVPGPGGGVVGGRGRVRPDVTTWWPCRPASTRAAAPGGRRPPRHRAAVAGCRGQRERRRGAARAGPDGRRGGHPAAGGVGGVRRGGAAGARRRRAPLRVAGVRRGGSTAPSGPRCGAWCRWTGSARPAGSRSAPAGCRRRGCAASCSPPPTGPACRRAACDNRTSDHWPFEKAGETVARVGGNDSPGYHSPRDRPSTVSPRQLDRVGPRCWRSGCGAS